MNPLAVVGACVGGVIGAAAWAAVSYFLNSEWSYVAILVGFVVGLGSSVLGGKGTTNGVVCAIIAALSILGGKVTSVSLLINSSAEELYAEYQTGAKDFAELKSKDDYAAFMVSHDYTNASSAADVSEEEVDDFTAQLVPVLNKFNAGEMTLDQFKSEPSVGFDLSAIDIVKDDLGGIDLLFLLIGIAVAFQVGKAKEED